MKQKRKFAGDCGDISNQPRAQVNAYREQCRDSSSTPRARRTSNFYTDQIDSSNVNIMDFFLIAQINLALQVTIVAILITSLFIKTRGKFLMHGLMMATGAALSVISFLLVMAPSLYSLVMGGSLFRNLPSDASFAVILHAGIGSVSEILGLWIVASWRLKRDFQSCMRKKKAMRVTFLLWLTSLLLGIVLFMWLYR